MCNREDNVEFLCSLMFIAIISSFMVALQLGVGLCGDLWEDCSSSMLLFIKAPGFVVNV